jgi:hypothetical protein
MQLQNAKLSIDILLSGFFRIGRKNPLARPGYIQSSEDIAPTELVAPRNMTMACHQGTLAALSILKNPHPPRQHILNLPLQELN